MAIPPGSTVGVRTVNIRFLWLLTVRAHGQYNHRYKNMTVRLKVLSLVRLSVAITRP